MSLLLALVAAGLLLATIGGVELRKMLIRQKRQYLTGGHLAKPVNRLGPGYGYNDPGSYEWHWKCKYCGEEHRRTEQFGEECNL